jgi:hypothetical protein
LYVRAYICVCARKSKRGRINERRYSSSTRKERLKIESTVAAY